MSRSLRFPTGKVPTDALREIVFRKLGIPCEELLQGPGVGEDAALLRVGNRIVAVASDPITGAVEDIGWLVVHINANDIASCGIRPRWFLCVAMLPEGADSSLLRGLMDQIHRACLEVGVSLIGGHTETTPGLDRPLLVGFMMGEAEEGAYVTSGGARPRDQIIMTKAAGIEGTAVLARDLRNILIERVGEETLKRAEGLLSLISVVPEALEAMRAGGVHALHDPTEGGVLNGLWEMAEASGVGLHVEEKAIRVFEETRLIAEALGIDPLKLLGSGALLIAADPEKAGGIAEAVRALGVEASIIGEARPLGEGRRLLRADGSLEPIGAVEQDELYAVIDRYGLM
ncbi:MAG: hydrogenase [Candidatus Bathyarchaeota archaeon B23]|nr:MAG: hydrogenase [Candidatus Bathyarchaeota archaeon B23]